jgi:hypothetical protein
MRKPQTPLSMSLTDLSVSQRRADIRSVGATRHQRTRRLQPSAFSKERLRRAPH